MVWCHGTETWKSCLLMTEEKRMKKIFRMVLMKSERILFIILRRCINYQVIRKLIYFIIFFDKYSHFYALPEPAQYVEERPRNAMGLMPL